VLTRYRRRRKSEADVALFVSVVVDAMKCIANELLSIVSKQLKCLKRAPPSAFLRLGVQAPTAEPTSLRNVARKKSR
jgi:hypothetical protein